MPKPCVSFFFRVVVGIFPAVKLPPWWAVPVKYGGLPPYYGNHAYRQSVTAEKRKTAYRQNITAVLHYRRKKNAIFWFYRFRQKVPPTLDTAKTYRQLSILPKECRQLSIPPKRYRQHWMQPKRYRRHWISPKRYADTGYRRKGTAYTGYRPKSTGLFVFVLCSLFFLVLRVPFR